MAQAGDAQALPIQGLFIKMRDLNTFGPFSIDLLSVIVFLLSYFFSIKRGEVLKGSLPFEAIAELVFIIVTLVFLARRMEGSIHLAHLDLVRGFMEISAIKQLLFICTLVLMMNSAHAENQTASRKLMASNVWERRDYAKAAAATLLAGLMTIGGAGVAGRMINRRRLVPAVLRIPAQLPAVPTISVQHPALPLIPAVPGVPGDNLDDVLARAPVATRLNSPLPWL